MEDNGFLSILKDAGVDVAPKISTTSFVDTGAYALNALISGSIYGGLPGNRISMVASPSGVGKTYLALSAVKTYMDSVPESDVLYFDTEFALEEDMVTKRGIDISRFHIIQTETLQDFRTKSIKILDVIEKQKPKSRKKLMIVLDSLSSLATKKEVDDAINSNDARDMTKAQIIRSIFRILTNKLGSLEIPLLIVSHVYSGMDQYNPTVISGGSGHIYSSSLVLTMNKSKLREGTNVVGNIIRITTYKSRYSKEQQKVELKLDYDTGLDRFFGLLPIAEKYGIITKEKTRYRLADGRLVFGKVINEHPEEVFTKDILDKIDAVCKYEFGLGMGEYPGKLVSEEEQEIFADTSDDDEVPEE